MNLILNSNDFQNDKYLFSLVSHNLEVDDCQIISDEENYVIVIGKKSKEIWLWTKSEDDAIINKIIEKINLIVSESDYSFVCKKSLYKYLKEKVDYISEPFIYDNYKCEEVLEPKKVEGQLSIPTMGDRDVIASFWKENCDYYGYDVSIELCQKFAEFWINSNKFYIWKKDDRIVSFVGYDIVDNTAEISHAYTDPKERGKGYMPYLIYEVTKIILSKGLLPVLNTNYSYESSNNAYKKVGFKETELMYSFSTTKHKKDILKQVL